MKASFISSKVLHGLILTSVILSAASLRAEEPARQFLEGLRQRGYHGIALDYLDSLQDSPMVSAEIKETILYERGVTLIFRSRDEVDITAQEKILDEAQANIRQFIGLHSDHILARTAQNELANVIVERARIKIEASRRAPNKAETKKILGESRKLYDEGYKAFLTSQNSMKEELEKVNKTVYNPDKDADLIERRTRLREDYLQTQLLTAAILEESVDTTEKGSKEYKGLLEKAALAYGDIYIKYRRLQAGLHARMYQGRCQKKLSNLKDALSYFDDLLQQPDSIELRSIKTTALLLAMECWIDPTQEKYAEAVKRGTAWLATARGAESSSPEWLKLQYLTAKSLKLRADDLKSDDPKSKDSPKLIEEARKLARFVARFSGDYQRPARTLLALLGSSVDGSNNDPKTFDEAFAAAHEAMQSIKIAKEVMKTIPPRLSREKDPAQKKELQGQIDSAQDILAAGSNKAFVLSRLALRFADNETDLDKVNSIRHLLCYLYWERNDYFDAAVLGEFVARRYPENSGSRLSAKIAMMSYLELLDENKSNSSGPQGDDLSFETAHVVDIANYMAKSWPDAQEGQEALNTLISFMIGNGELAKAQEYLDKIPTDSPIRSAAELQTGQSLWKAYINGARELQKWETESVPEGVDVEAKKTQLAELKARSEKTLADGVSRMSKSGKVSTTLITAKISLAQIYIDTNQTDKAIALLEEPNNGLLTLVQKKHEATLAGRIVEETYRIALRAYISSLATASDGAAVIEKAQGIMEQLKAAVGSTPEGKKQLVDIYFTLARNLESQIQIADPESKKAISQGFETFLHQVSAEATDVTQLNWVAETFLGLGNGFETGQGPLPAEAKRYYNEASKAYQAILTRGEKNEGFLTAQRDTLLRKRLATTHRKLSQFKDAMDIYEKLLRQNNMMLDVQEEAAMTYQQWAPSAKPSYYSIAISGGRRNKKTNRLTIWGWGKVSKMTHGDPRFNDNFHNARYNIALCRFKQGKSEKNKKTLESAKDSIRLTVQLNAANMNKKQRAKYDSLMRTIQKELGQKQIGLAKFKQPQPKKPPPKK